jgi:hypothetical protein
MRPARPNSLENPFKNRFNDPVTWRLDEMQAHSGVVWPRQRSHGVHGDCGTQAVRGTVRFRDHASHEANDGESRRPPSVAVDEKFLELSDSVSGAGILASLLALFVVLLASAVLFRF